MTISFFLTADTSQPDWATPDPPSVPSVPESVEAKAVETAQLAQLTQTRPDGSDN